MQLNNPTGSFAWERVSVSIEVLPFVAVGDGLCTAFIGDKAGPRQTRVIFQASAPIENAIVARINPAGVVLNTQCSVAVVHTTMLHGHICLIFAAVLGVTASLASAAECNLPAIRINAGRDIAPVPRRLFGVNLRQDMQQDAPIRRFLTDTGITLFRYPDSIDNGYTWDWAARGVMSQNGKVLTSPLARFDTANRCRSRRQG